MKSTIKELAHQQAAKILELRRNHEETIQNRKAVMTLSSDWAARATGRVDFLHTEEEIQLYYSALVASDLKMRYYK